MFREKLRHIRVACDKLEAKYRWNRTIDIAKKGKHIFTPIYIQSVQGFLNHVNKQSEERFCIRIRVSLFKVLNAAPVAAFVQTCSKKKGSRELP